MKPGYHCGLNAHETEIYKSVSQRTYVYRKIAVNNNFSKNRFSVSGSLQAQTIQIKYDRRLQAFNSHDAPSRITFL